MALARFLGFFIHLRQSVRAQRDWLGELRFMITQRRGRRLRRDSSAGFTPASRIRYYSISLPGLRSLVGRNLLAIEPSLVGLALSHCRFDTVQDFGG